MNDKDKKPYEVPRLVVAGFKTELGSAVSGFTESRHSAEDAWGSTGGFMEERSGSSDAWSTSGGLFESRTEGGSAW